METLDIIKQLCKEKGISIAQLESDLDYGNGSLAKSKSMSADRMYKIAKYFGVSMEYLMTGKTITKADDEVAILRQQQSILKDISSINDKINDYYKGIAACEAQLKSLKQEYDQLELKKREFNTTTTSVKDITPNFDLFDMFSQISDSNNSTS